MKKIVQISAMASVALLLSACGGGGGPSKPSTYNTPSFNAGEADGCTTAQGAYTKNSEAFRTDKGYNDGWFYGRKRCNPSQQN